MNPEDKCVGSLYSFEGNAEIVADVGSKLLFQMRDGSWAEARDGRIPPKRMKGIKTVMEIHPDRMIEVFNIRRCTVMIDYLLNSGSPEATASIIRQHGVVTKTNGCTQISLRARDMIEYIRPMLEAIFEECMIEVAHPWGPASAKKLFSMIRDNPTLSNRAVLIFNIVIKDEFGQQLFRWND